MTSKVLRISCAARTSRFSATSRTTAWCGIDGVSCAMPAGTFYVFPSVAAICNRLGITSHGLALYLLEGADDTRGVACLGGECFGDAGRGFLRLSCAQPDERIAEAFAFMAEAFKRKDRVDAYLKTHPEHRLKEHYEEPQPARLA